jgi:hypothetical protein
MGPQPLGGHQVAGHRRSALSGITSRCRRRASGLAGLDRARGHHAGDRRQSGSPGRARRPCRSGPCEAAVAEVRQRMALKPPALGGIAARSFSPRQLTNDDGRFQDAGSVERLRGEVRLVTICEARSTASRCHDAVRKQQCPNCEPSPRSVSISSISRWGRSAMGKRRNARCSGDIVRAGPYGVRACSTR